MNQTQLDQVKSVLAKIEEVDLIKAISASLPEDVDLDKHQFTNITATQFCSLTHRIIKQFNYALNSDMRFNLPFQFNSGSEFGSGQLFEILNKLSSFIVNAQWLEAEAMLQMLAYYQIVCGFFIENNTKHYDIPEIDFTEKLNKQAVIEKLLDKNQERLSILVGQFKKANHEVRECFQKIEDELSVITQKRNEINQQSEQLSDILNVSNERKGKIDGIETMLKEKLSDATRYFDEKQNSFNEFDKLANSKIAVMDNNIAQHEKYMEQLDDKKTIFDNRFAYLNELIGREVGVSLFETFKQRKKELVNPTRFWAGAVFVMAILTVAGVYAIFSGFFGYYKEVTGLSEWPLFLLNTLKCLPFVYLLYFVSKQYSIERRYQEEYAFKSAVALTIEAYTAQLLEEANKDKLIIESVKKVYDLPGLLCLNRKGRGQNEEDDYMKMLKTALETVKNASAAIK